MAKWDTLSWTEQTRRAIDRRLTLPVANGVLDPGGRATLASVINRVVPQPAGRAPVNALAVLLDRIGRDAGDGFRPAGLPRLREAWTIGLNAIDAAAQTTRGPRLCRPDAGRGGLAVAAGGERPGDRRGVARHRPQVILGLRLIPDIVSAYWAHPSAWSAMGFGGPASPRGYIRLDADGRDPWEAVEAGDGGLLPVSWRNRHVG